MKYHRNYIPQTSQGKRVKKAGFQLEKRVTSKKTKAAWEPFGYNYP